MAGAVLDVRVLRPLMLGGRSVAAGVVLDVDLADAVALIDSGRAELVDPVDESFLRAERRTQQARVLASLPRVSLAESNGPWIPRGR